MAAQLLNSPQLILTMGASAAGLLILFFGIFYILGALFLARDTEFLASLPLKQNSIFLSKFILVLLGEYPIALFLMLPPVIIYGAGAQKGILYYITALICILFLPIVPLIISSLLSLCLMHIVSRSKRRDLIIIVGSIILFLAHLWGRIFFCPGCPRAERKWSFFSRSCKGATGWLNGREAIFPPSVWITSSLPYRGGSLKEPWISCSFVGCLLHTRLASCLADLSKRASAQLEAEKELSKETDL